MQPVKSLINQYRGINAHLHSQFQAEGDWEAFHSSHIADLTRMLKIALRPLGYDADIDQSLQIRRYEVVLGRPEPDVIVFNPTPALPFSMRPVAAVAESVATTAAIEEVLELKDEEKTYNAIGIYRVEPTRPYKGRPVTWIELLSPSNKPGKQDFDIYAAKRRYVLHTRTNFIELDYLHDTPPTVAHIQNYRLRTDENHVFAGASPYRVLVFEPHPSMREGTVAIYPFFVDDLLPTIRIPLLNEVFIDFDLNAPYKRTFEEMFYGDRVDYTQFPLKFMTYARPDQERILSRLMRVLQMAQRGESLETSPQPLEVVPLDEILGVFESLRA